MHMYIHMYKCMYYGFTSVCTYVRQNFSKITDNFLDLNS